VRQENQMKKALIAVLLLALAVAGVYLFFFYSDKNYPERIFPENTIAYMAFSGVDSIQKDGKQTLLWQKIESSPRKSLYLRQLDQFMSLSESVVGVDLRPLLTQFSREVSLGFLPVTGRAQSGALVGYIKKQGRTREFLEMKLDPGLRRRFPDLKKAPALYRDITYYKYSSKMLPSQVSPCYAFVDHHLLLTSTEVGMKVLLDTRDKKLRPLRKLDAFRDSKKEVHYSRGLFFFINADSAFQYTKNQLPSRAQFFWPAVVQITGLEAVQGFAYSIGFQNQGFREEGFVSVKRNRQGFAKAYMEQKPQKLAGLLFIPAESHVAGAATLPDTLSLWTEVEAQIQKTLSGSQFSQYRAILEMLAGFLDFDLKKDLFEPVGRQFSFGYELPAHETEGKNTNYFVALELRNPEHFRGVLNRLASLGELRGAPRHQESYQGIHLESLDLHTGGMDVTPAYAIEASWLYFATNQAFLKQAIDVTKNKKNITSLPDFKRVTAGFPDEVNSISYTNTQVTLQKYAAFMDARSQQAEGRWLRDYGLAEEMKELSKSLFGSGSCIIVEKDGIRYRSYSSIPNAVLYLPAILASYH